MVKAGLAVLRTDGGITQQQAVAAAKAQSLESWLAELLPEFTAGAYYHALGESGTAEAVREQGLEQLKRDAAATRTTRRVGFGRADGPVWVSALIDDGDIAAAWDAAAGIASEHQWRTLADLVSQDRPAAPASSSLPT